jgi:predicted membrane-bound spermidine synthase
VDIRLYLNEQLQFSSLDERIYHEAFVHVPFALGKSIESVLVLGGGDGLALREIYMTVICEGVCPANLIGLQSIFSRLIETGERMS